MARRPQSKSPVPLRHDLSFENETGDYDLSPTSTLQRGYGLPTSPKEHQGAFTRIRRSLTTGKEKYKQLYKEVLSENDTLKLERDLLKEELKLTRSRLAGISGSSPYHVSGLQIGDHNTMINTVDMGALEEAMDEVETLIAKMTGAIDTVVEEKTKVELQLENQKVILLEIQDALSKCSKKYDEKNKMDSKSFGELKTLLLDLQSDRSDLQVLGDCIEGLSEHINVHHRMVSDFESLPERIKPGITRLVNKFGTMSWHEFATHLGLNPSSIDHLGDDPQQGSNDNKMAMNKDMCAKVMAEWVKGSEHTVAMFMDHLRAIEKEKAEGAKRAFTKAISLQKRHRKMHGHLRSSTNSIHSTNSHESSSTYKDLMLKYTNQQLGEQRTQTAHAVELCRLVLDTMKPMKTKIDTIHERIVGGERRTSHKSGEGGMDRVEELVIDV